MNKISIFFIIICIFLLRCKEIPVNEKVSFFSGSKWYTEKPVIASFEIKDTTSAYNIFASLRHTDNYDYQNIWTDLIIINPKNDTILNQRFESGLATDQYGWLGIGVGDIWDVRLELLPQYKFSKPGSYTFVLKQIMRQNPLNDVYSAGIRIEKVK